MKTRPPEAFDGTTAGRPAYVQLDAGPYRLALPTASVSRVSQDVPLDVPLLSQEIPASGRPEVTLGGEQVPVIDLGFLVPGARVLPFVVAVETSRGRHVLAAQRVRYLPDAVTVGGVPSFGLPDPTLFVGALRAPDGVVLVLDPERLERLAPRASQNLTLLHVGKYTK